MLGEMLGEERGKMTGMRVLPAEGAGPRVEASWQGSGKLLGVEYNGMGTYIAVMTPAGVLSGQGQGVMMGKDGEMASWTGGGVGKPGKGMAANWRGAIYYQSPSPKLARLNSVAVIYEFDVDENGNTHAKLWEWK